ncbi:hypothetical protein RF11_14206 [Thelohanellus kitauei]|uniref:Uncharacterized protein n=1 Tax=Thelohanellus kitauei TaxID=669202 RepID=A0A0C2N7P3_THEKT|nr:hypothetical protein RF11_14206 [Thelohanellus kitauei]
MTHLILPLSAEFCLMVFEIFGIFEFSIPLTFIVLATRDLAKRHHAIDLVNKFSSYHCLNLRLLLFDTPTDKGQPWFSAPAGKLPIYAGECLTDLRSGVQMMERRRQHLEDRKRLQGSDQLHEHWHNYRTTKAQSIHQQLFDSCIKIVPIRAQRTMGQAADRQLNQSNLIL